MQGLNPNPLKSRSALNHQMASLSQFQLFLKAKFGYFGYGMILNLKCKPYLTFRILLEKLHSIFPPLCCIDLKRTMIHRLPKGRQSPLKSLYGLVPPWVILPPIYSCLPLAFPHRLPAPHLDCAAFSFLKSSSDSCHHASVH